jgi:hypothetical protein
LVARIVPGQGGGFVASSVPAVVSWIRCKNRASPASGGNKGHIFFITYFNRAQVLNNQQNNSIF